MNELQFTQTLIKQVGRMILEMQKTARAEFKTHNDIVTEADLAAEKMIVEAIQKEFPEDQIIAEENYHNQLTDARTWVIDPIDGTVNYSRGIPIYAVSIGLMERQKSIMGCIYLPETDELFWAEEGEGAFCNGKKIKVSEERDPKKSVVHVGDSYIYPLFGKEIYRIETFLHLNKEIMRARCEGSAVVEAMHLASGRIEAYLCDAFLWDFAASHLIVQEAGGKATRLNGEAYDPREKDMVYSNGLVHEELLQLLNKS